jgi:hypothetical protein
MRAASVQEFHREGTKATKAIDSRLILAPFAFSRRIISV